MSVWNLVQILVDWNVFSRGAYWACRRRDTLSERLRLTFDPNVEDVDVNNWDLISWLWEEVEMCRPSLFTVYESHTCTCAEHTWRRTSEKRYTHSQDTGQQGAYSRLHKTKSERSRDASTLIQVELNQTRTKFVSHNQLQLWKREVKPCRLTPPDSPPQPHWVHIPESSFLLLLCVCVCITTCGRMTSVLHRALFLFKSMGWAPSIYSLYTSRTDPQRSS